MGVVLRSDGGELLPLDPARWHREPSAVEQNLLENMAAPVLDVGCGPGRLVIGLGRLGVPALGVDTAPAAVELARRRGAAVLQRSVFGPVPGCGRWKTVLLLDGNIGIGGDPVRLLERCRQLAACRATVVVEVDEPGTGCSHHRARLERDAEHGPWFPWAVVGADAIAGVADRAGLDVQRVEHATGESRWFAHLRTRPDGAPPMAEQPDRRGIGFLRVAERSEERRDGRTEQRRGVA
jgi:SAM-dependent methyltransferase